MMILLAILLPPLAMLLAKKPFQALLCLVLQCTLLGWIPAAIWAVVTVNNAKAESRHEELLKVARGG